MRTSHLEGNVSPDHTLHLTVRLPVEVSLGEYRVVLEMSDNPIRPIDPRPPLDFPVDDYGPWPRALPFRREALYSATELP